MRDLAIKCPNAVQWKRLPPDTRELDSRRPFFLPAAERAEGVWHFAIQKMVKPLDVHVLNQGIENLAQW